jgi:protein-S-isoprenylcysteine O-methyltransferase Ste14
MMLLAISEMRRQRTTLHPHRAASKLVQSGIFSRTRNPIYLGDILILAGVLLKLDAVMSLIFLPFFAWILESRFIIPEENRLRRHFRSEFARYCQKVRRWV